MIRIVLNYGILAGVIYAGFVFADPDFMSNLGAFISATVAAAIASTGADFAAVETWWLWALSWLPMSWPHWVKVLGVLCAAHVAVYALLSVHTGKVLATILKTALRGLKWIVGIPYALIRRALLLRRSPFGKSDWAKLADLKEAGLLNPGGLFLGQFRKSWRYWYDLHHHGDGHFITIALPGGGKTTAAVIPPLLTAKEGSFIITDPKGEVTAITRRYRASKGKVFYLNPFHADFSATTGLDYPDSGFNPFDLIEAGDNTRAQADALARYLMVTDRRDSGSYFQDEGAELLSLLITWMVKYEPPENKTLSYLYELVREEDPLRLFSFMDYVDDPHIKHEVGRYRSMLRGAAPQWIGAISKAQLATKRYVPQTPLGRHVEKSGFDPRILKTEDVTVYILLPPDHVETAAPWLILLKKDWLKSWLRADSIVVDQGVGGDDRAETGGARRSVLRVLVRGSRPTQPCAEAH